MNIRYFLVATGSISTPKLDIAVHSPGAIRAIEDAERIVKVLHPAGYWQFVLWDHHDDLPVGPQVVTTFKVEQPDLIVTYT